MGFTFSFFPPQIASHCWNCHRWNPEKYGIRWSNKSLALHSSNPLHCTAEILSTVRHNSWAEGKDLRNLSWGWHSFQMLGLQITQLFAQSRLIFFTNWMCVCRITIMRRDKNRICNKQSNLSLYTCSQFFNPKTFLAGNFITNNRVISYYTLCGRTDQNF